MHRALLGGAQERWVHKHRMVFNHLEHVPIHVSIESRIGLGHEHEACASHVCKHDVFLLRNPILKMSVGIEAFVAVSARALQRASRQNSGLQLQVGFHFGVYSLRVGIRLINQNSFPSMVKTPESLRAIC